MLSCLAATISGMKPLPTPQQIAAHDLAAVSAHKAALLERLQTRAEKTGDPAMRHILDATADDVHIEAIGTQGTSKHSYRIEIGGYKAILAVFVDKDAGGNWKRASFDNRIAFRRHLRTQGVPVPGKIGSPFHLAGVPGACELTEYVAGYQKKRGDLFTDSELQSIGDTLGRMHNAGDFRPRMSLASLRDGVRLVRDYVPGVAYGYTHGDFSHGNIVFDPNTGQISGLIDFECARHMRFVDEIAYCLRCYASDAEQTPDGVHIRVNPDRARVLLHAYEAHRPLSPEEKRELDRVIPKQLAIERRCWNEQMRAQQAHQESPEFGIAR